MGSDDNFIGIICLGHLVQAHQLADMQRQVHEWTGQYTPQYWPAQQILSRLAEEVGEVARNINHLHGFKKKKWYIDYYGNGLNAFEMVKDI